VAKKKKNLVANFNSPSPTILGGPNTATSTPLLVEFLFFVGIEPCIMEFKYMWELIEHVLEPYDTWFDSYERQKLH
jgi:hypothetical protein